MEFYRADYPTIQSGKVVRYRKLHYPYPGLHPEISASRDGVNIDGSWERLHPADVSRIAAVLERAFEQHEYIKRTREALPFDNDPECVMEYRNNRFGDKYEVIATRKTEE